jgi:Ni,Fe-hydrogenase maturation factor
MSVPRSKNVLVLGLGNTLLADDGVVVHVVRRLALDPATPPWVRAVDGGTMGFRLTSILVDCGNVLIIDAADFAAKMDVPENAELIRDLMAASQLLQDHVIHFYRLQSLDWVNPISALAWQCEIGQIMTIFGGKTRTRMSRSAARPAPSPPAARCPAAPTPPPTELVLIDRTV